MANASILERARLFFAGNRLLGHMYDRLVGGGTPDCPCGQCDRDRAFLAAAGHPWDHPERAAWWRDFKRTLEAATR